MIDFRLNLKGLGGCHYVTCIFNPLAIFVLPKSTFDGFLGYAGAVGKYVVNAAILQVVTVRLCLMLYTIWFLIVLIPLISWCVKIVPSKKWFPST